MMKNTMHTSKINSLDFNLFQTNLLASVGNQNEVTNTGTHDPIFYFLFFQTFCDTGLHLGS